MTQETKSGVPEGNEPEPELNLEDIVAQAKQELVGVASGPYEATEPVASEPVAVTPEPPKTDWLNTVIPEDAPVSGFFKGKPVSEVLKSHKHAEDKIRELGHELNALRAEMAAKLAANDVIGTLLAPAKPKPPEEKLPDAVIEPERFAQVIEEKNARRMEELLAKKEQEAKEREAEQLELNKKFEVAQGAIKVARTALPPMDDTRFDVVASTLIREVRDNAKLYDGGFFSPENYILAYRRIYGEIPPPQISQVAPVADLFQEKPNPPEFGKSAPRQGSGGKVPSLRKEQEDIVNQIARTMLSAAGIDGEEAEAARAAIISESAARLSQKRT